VGSDFQLAVTEIPMKTNEVSSTSSLAIAITIAAVSAFVLACGSSYPSESAGRRFLEAFGKIDGSYSVKSFTKTNGAGDDKRYTMEYTAVVECQKVNFDPNAFYVGGSPYAVRCKEVGTRYTDSGKIEFQKTDNGWRAPDGNIY
jgi:hypothetical protein